MKKLLVLLVMMLMAAVAGAELMPDGGFESGSWSGSGAGSIWGAYDLNATGSDVTWSSTWWLNGIAPGLTSDAHSGGQAMKMQMDPGPHSWAYLWTQGGYEYGSFDFTGGYGWVAAWQQGLAVSEGNVLLASAWVKEQSGNAADGIAQLKLEFYDDSGTRTMNDYYQYLPVTADWTQVSITAPPAAAGTTNVTMVVGMGNWGLNDGGHTTLFDDVSVTIVPEPMTIGLLGIGGLFLRRRKA